MSCLIELQYIFATHSEIRNGYDCSSIGFGNWLGIITNDPKEIKKAYRKAMIKYHPDKNPHMADICNEICKSLTVFFNEYAKSKTGL